MVTRFNSFGAFSCSVGACKIVVWWIKWNKMTECKKVQWRSKYQYRNYWQIAYIRLCVRSISINTHSLSHTLSHTLSLTFDASSCDLSSELAFSSRFFSMSKSSFSFCNSLTRAAIRSNVRCSSILADCSGTVSVSELLGVVVSDNIEDGEIFSFINYQPI